MWRIACLAQALMLAAPAVYADQTTGFRIGDQNWQVPVRKGFCATDDPRLSEMAHDNLSGLIAVLAMHVHCKDLEQSKARGEPEKLRLHFWGVMVDNGRPMLASPDMLNELEALRVLVREGSDQEYRAMANGIQQTMRRGGTSMHCLSLDTVDDILGGKLCTSGPDGFKIDLAGALRPLQGVVAIAVVMHVPGGGPFTPDFSQAAAMLTSMRSRQ
jgi:hypothetical protein